MRSHTHSRLSELKYTARRLAADGKFQRVLYERLTEPIHLNLLSLPVALLGSFRRRVQFDLVVRQQNAFCLLRAADFAKQLGLRRIAICEFGVASGAGLLNMAAIADRVSETTGVEIRIFGFDTGTGMPPPIDYRDQPEAFGQGDFPMGDLDALRSMLPGNAELIIGDVRDTVPTFLSTLSEECPLGFASIDVDYYSSAKTCMKVFDGEPTHYLPMTLVWLDDVGVPSSNPWVGELLATREFNDANPLRKLHPYTNLRAERLFARAKWIDQVHVLHVLDHPTRMPRTVQAAPAIIDNPYMSRVA